MCVYAMCGFGVGVAHGCVCLKQFTVALFMVFLISAPVRPSYIVCVGVCVCVLVWVCFNQYTGCIIYGMCMFVCVFV